MYVANIYTHYFYEYINTLTQIFIKYLSIIYNTVRFFVLFGFFILIVIWQLSLTLTAFTLKSILYVCTFWNLLKNKTEYKTFTLFLQHCVMIVYNIPIFSILFTSHRLTISRELPFLLDLFIDKMFISKTICYYKVLFRGINYYTSL